MKIESKVIMNSILRLLPRSIILIVALCSITIQLAAQTKSDMNFRQYLFPEFSKSVVITKTGESSNSVLNYNTVAEKMVIEMGSVLLNMTNIETVDTIIIQNRKFVPVNQVFYEVLVNGPSSLFIQHKSNLIPPGSPAGYGSTSQTSSIKNYSKMTSGSGALNLEIPSDFTINPAPVYWIRKSGNVFSFYNKRQFLKIFPEKNDEIKKFIKQNHLKMIKRDDLIKLVNYCNEVI